MHIVPGIWVAYQALRGHNPGAHTRSLSSNIYPLVVAVHIPKLLVQAVKFKVYLNSKKDLPFN